MGNTMTVTTLCIFLMDRRIMRPPMAIKTHRQMPMFGMTLGAGKGGMFCRPGLQQFICLSMTTGTDFLGLVSRIGDPQRRMYRMTGLTVRGIQHCHGAVILVTFITHWNTSMFFGMAERAFLLSMHAHFCLQACCNLVMTQLAAIFKLGRGRYRNQRLVWVCMAR